ncbi:MAG: hypothetical protein KDD62_06680, partial [Bdellovibrionales bacterium]|nr:hypothetical protein [Bdellovibrionales bacterium]
MKSLFLIILLTSVWAPSCLLALEGPYTAAVRGVGQLIESGQGNLSIAALGGRYNIRLKTNDTPSGLPGLALYHGYFRRAGADQPIGLVAASYFHNVLTLEFHSRRKRNLLIKIDHERGFVGRVRHRPAHKMGCHLLDEGKREPSSINRSVNLSDTPKTVSLGIDLDYEFVKAHASVDEAKANVLQILNAVNVIYLKQLSISFAVHDINALKHPIPAFASYDADVLIDKFGKHVMKRGKKFGDLRHLFTGKDTALQGDKGLVGVAYVGVVCRDSNRSFGFTELTHPSVQALVTAHELAHNLGAGHDYTTPSLMYPRASATHTSFSVFSLYEISNYLRQYGTCLREAVPSLRVDLRVRSGGSIKLISRASNFSTDGCQAHMYASRSKRRLSNVE